MIEHWLSEYWWILAALVYVILLVIVAGALARRGTFGSTWPKITLAITCLIIVLIPTMHPPGSYVNAVIAVCSLVILFSRFFKSEKPSEPAER
ncbi:MULTISPECIES: hypothetical protein [unclassified Mycobacterium]|uniref:hypothetical protein n=1 Tax=unclassified Mycobacterium TaxID=2642494 RepID=UPI0029C9A7EB|nr:MULTISPECIES: hypothetical protein [unclassified Mycobacterium]